MVKVVDMWLTPGERPNGLQASPDGLWVIDAADNHLYRLGWEDGSVLLDVPTETYKSSGVTVGGGYVWVASTHNKRLYKLDEDGTTIEYSDPPGIGVRDPRDTGADYVRPHGMEWVDGKLWVCIKPALRIYQIDPETREVLHSIPTPGPGPHGIAWDNGDIWCADKPTGVIHKLDAESGKVLDEIRIESPVLDGLTIHEDTLIFCSEPTRQVCRVEL
jgi:DNA-binding beta-propeller fold protein YncE